MKSVVQAEPISAVLAMVDPASKLNPESQTWYCTQQKPWFCRMQTV